MRPPLEVAVQTLAGVCDGARALDDMGYNATDTRFGKFLSSVPYETWTPKMKYAGWMMLHKYTGQLARAGIDYNTIPVPPHPDTVPPPKPPPEAPKRITREGPVRYRLEFPYKAALIALVRDIPGRRFERQDKYWTVPKSPEAAALIQALAEEGFQVEDGILDELRATQTDAQALLVESRAEDAELHIDDLGGTLRPFQRAGVRYALKSRRCFIADQMGLGKTIEALAAVHAAEAFPAVVVCPATLKLNWRRETKKWLPGRRVRVLSGGKGLGIARSAVDVTILNYDILGKRMAELLKIEPKAVIFDESHYAKNGKAKRTKAARALAAGVDMRLCLTGTPITNRPVEWAAQLEILDRLDELGGYWQFVHRYCNTPEAPIWMADFSFKTLGEIERGDQIIGWHPHRGKRSRGIDIRQTLTRTNVLEVKRRYAPIVKLIMESGHIIRCTPDHRWLSAASHNQDWRYCLPLKGRKLARVIDLPSPLPSAKLRAAAWLGGVYDGEGTRGRIAQSQEKNPQVHAEISRVLDLLGLRHSSTSEGHLINGGRQAFLNFLTWCKPVKTSRWIDSQLLSGRFRIPDRILDIVPDGRGEVISLTTASGNYVAWGYASKNCAAFKGKWGWDFSGSCNLDELNTRIRALCYIRRNKSDVLKELPPKIRAIVPVELDNRAEYNRAKADVVRFLADKAAKNREFLASIEDLDEEERKRRTRARMEDAAYRAESAKQLVEIEALKQVAVRGKMTAICEWVEDFLESGEKLVIFAHHRDIQRELMDWLPQHNPAQVIGGQRDIDKQENIDRFQDDDACRLIVCSLMAGGVGITLTAASNVLFVELGWNPAQGDQCEDRLHRIGQTDCVNCWYLLAENTIDFTIYKLIEEKRQVIDAATEGGPLETQTGILNALIEELIQEENK